MGDDSGSEASDGSSEGGLFGAAASWMEGQEGEGTAAVGGGDLVAAREWLTLLAAFDGIFVTASFWAFGWVIAE